MNGVIWTEHRFVAFDGTPVFYRRAAPAEKLRALVMILHGMGEHGGRYRPLGDYLAAMGFECFVPDLRGFGKSGGKRGCVRRIAHILKDLEALGSIAAREAKDAPFFILGHSFGGLLASIYAGECRPKPRGLVLTSPIFGIKIPVAPWRHALGILSSYVTPDFTQSTRVEASTLTHDASILRAYATDPLIHHQISSSLYRELIGAIARKKEIAAAILCPTLVLQSGRDAVVDAVKAREFYEELRVADKQLEVYEDFYHEILNEIDRFRVFSRIGSWISQKLL